MTVASETPFKQITADGSTKIFSGNFTILDDEDLKVYEDGVIATTGFTVSGVGTSKGATITYTTAPASAVVVTLIRDMVVKRDTDYQNSGDFLSSTVNTDFDRLTMMSQQIEERIIKRMLAFSDTEPGRTEALNALPSPAAGELVHWDSNKQLQNTGILQATLSSLVSTSITGVDAVDLWEEFSGTPTRTANGVFTLTGDQTSTFKVGTKLKLDDAGTYYGVIVSSVYTSLTTITILTTANLTASLSKVYHLVSSDHGTARSINIDARTYLATANTTITKTLKFDDGGKIDFQSYTLTFTGSPTIKAGIHQIFDNVGTVSGRLRVKAIYPEWFGAAGDDSTDDKDELKACIDFAEGITGAKRLLLTQNYRVSVTKGTNDKWGVNVKGDNVTLELANGSTIRRHDTDITTYAKAFPILLVGTPDSDVAAATTNFKLKGGEFIGEDTRHTSSASALMDGRQAIWVKNTKGARFVKNKWTSIDSGAIYFQRPAEYNYETSTYYNTTKNYDVKIISPELYADPHATITSATITAAVAVDKGAGQVGIPITAHSFSSSDLVVISGTAKYNGAYTIASETANEIVITATYVEETFTGAETVKHSSTAGRALIHAIVDRGCDGLQLINASAEWCDVVFDCESSYDDYDDVETDTFTHTSSGLTCKRAGRGTTIRGGYVKNSSEHAFYLNGMGISMTGASIIVDDHVTCNTNQVQIRGRGVNVSGCNLTGVWTALSITTPSMDVTWNCTVQSVGDHSGGIVNIHSAGLKAVIDAKSDFFDTSTYKPMQNINVLGSISMSEAWQKHGVGVRLYADNLDLTNFPYGQMQNVTLGLTMRNPKKAFLVLGGATMFREIKIKGCNIRGKSHIETKFGYQGSHDGSNNVAILSDSGESWTDDEFIGWTVYNLTDGSSGLVTDNDATTITATLSGGTDDDWDASDTYEILPPLNSKCVIAADDGETTTLRDFEFTGNTCKGFEYIYYDDGEAGGAATMEFCRPHQNSRMLYIRRFATDAFKAPTLDNMISGNTGNYFIDRSTWYNEFVMQNSLHDGGYAANARLKSCITLKSSDNRAYYDDASSYDSL